MVALLSCIIADFVLFFVLDGRWAFLPMLWANGITNRLQSADYIYLLNVNIWIICRKLAYTDGDSDYYSAVLVKLVQTQQCQSISQ